MRVALLVLCAALRLSAADPLLVIAVDGFRYDYFEKLDVPNLKALRDEGASATALKPVFPSTTFPNFYAMATGLRPAKHGIVAMHFYDRGLDKEFHYSRNGTEGFWYIGVPFWETAQKNGKRVATYFWPGSDAEIHGIRPWQYFKYDSKTTHEMRVKQVTEWFAMTDGQRPDVVVVYFADVDSAGHAHGPDSQEVRDAASRTDKAVGEIVKGARASTPSVNIVVVSDHGMSAVHKIIDFSNDADFTGCRTMIGPVAFLYCSDPARVEKELKSKPRDYLVYRKGKFPKHLHYEGSERIADLMLLTKGREALFAQPPGDRNRPPLKGMHGYDPDANPEMGGILIGAGPAFKQGAHVTNARTIDVHPLLLRLMGLKPQRGLDGQFNRVKGLLR